MKKVLQTNNNALENQAKIVAKSMPKSIKKLMIFRTDFQLIFDRILRGFGSHLSFQIDAKINEKTYQKND